MNERIKELAIKSGIAYQSKQQAYETNDGFTVISSKDSLEKFAKLMVEDFTRIIREEWYRVNNQEYEKDPRSIGIQIGTKGGLNTALNLVRKNFGME